MIDIVRGPGDFPRELGLAAGYESVVGYYIDLRKKAAVEPVDEHALRVAPLHVVTCQWGLGCYDRYLAGDGERWLAGAVRIGRYLLSTQVREGPVDGAWRHTRAFPHTYHLPSGWISGMAQGQAASLLVRLYDATGDESFADGAIRAISPLGMSVAAGGVSGALGTGFIPEEYPTDPPSLVLNGAIFAIWGYYDVAMALGHSPARTAFDETASTIADNLHRWDLSYWSRYDLFPHRRVAIAAPWYHALHVHQLDVLGHMTARPEYYVMRDKWRHQARSRYRWARAWFERALFRISVPKRPAALP